MRFRVPQSHGIRREPSPSLQIDRNDGSCLTTTCMPSAYECSTHAHFWDSDPEAVKDKTPVKGLGDAPYHPSTQSVGAFVPEGAEEDLDMIEKLARGYIYEGKEKRLICAHNAEVGLCMILSVSVFTLSRLRSTSVLTTQLKHGYFLSRS